MKLIIELTGDNLFVIQDLKEIIVRYIKEKCSVHRVKLTIVRV